MEGLEPPRLAAPDPKSGAATNYATSGDMYPSAAIIPPEIGFVGTLHLEKEAQIYRLLTNKEDIVVNSLLQLAKVSKGESEPTKS
jgi:hypothetical protein